MSNHSLQFGTGTPLLFVPGSFATYAAWFEVCEALDGSLRKVLTSLPGYGRTPERRDPRAPRMADLVEFVVEEIAQLGTPVHLVAHCFGGLPALAAAQARIPGIKSLVLFEPCPVFARYDGPTFGWVAPMLKMLDGFRAALAANDAEASRAALDFWNWDGYYDDLPIQTRRASQRMAGTGLLDWDTARDYTPHMSEFGALDLPCTVIQGTKTVQTIRDLSNLLAASLPRCKARQIDGADHRSIMTHADACADLIRAHLDWVDA